MGVLANSECFFGHMIIHSFNQACQKWRSPKMAFYLIFKLAFDWKRGMVPHVTQGEKVMQLLYFSVFFRQLIHFDLLCISWASFLISND